MSEDARPLEKVGVPYWKPVPTADVRSAGEILDVERNKVMLDRGIGLTDLIGVLVAGLGGRRGRPRAPGSPWRTPPGTPAAPRVRRFARRAADEADQVPDEHVALVPG